MNTQVKFVDGTTITVDEFNANKIKGKVMQNPNLHVAIHVEDVEGSEYLFPFSNVAYVSIAREKDEIALDPETGVYQGGAPKEETDILEMSIDELKQYLSAVTDAEAVKLLLDHEQAKEKPRKGAIDLLQAKAAEL